MVCDTVIYHPTLVRLKKFLDATAGREKALRLLQYLCRFLSYYCYQKGFNLDTIQLFKKIQGIITTNRKALRFLKPLNHLTNASKTFDNKLMDSILRYTAVSKDIAYVFYLSLDSINWFKMLGIISHKKFPKNQKYTNWCWCIGLISGLLNDLRKIQISHEKKVALLKCEDEKKDEKEVKILLADAIKLGHTAKRRLCWDLLDIFIVLNNLKFLNFDDGAIGGAGVITSILGLQDIWSNIKV
ncbi:hypothetical protein PACTADRAFT_32773 [Pachysolen tannophilus NRRL Y-2460]|uniref:Peroxisomal biogenesis factor 11 n=1 Tax=Pachysolen tannophilus NRRL Y-2460 TaxID=669874 RepID=A0A1E4TZY8_PACTA|nr:hypothetical protein PACTADRAFT_32773 [Pachysolen tannophilus NRRL Y-2460]